MIKATLKVLAVASVLGIVASVVGLAIVNRNVDLHGAEYSSYRFDWLAFGGLPGMLITEWYHGADFQLGEIRQHQWAVICWNAVCYGAFAVGALWLIRLFTGGADVHRPSGRKIAQQVVVGNRDEVRDSLRSGESSARLPTL